MKKTIALLFIALAVFALAGCDGTMHNTLSSNVTFKVINFPVPDGELDVRGGFFKDSWSTGDVRKFTVTSGTGEYTTGSMIISALFKFSFCTPGSWVRPFYPATAGNSDDNGSMQNFEYTIPMDGGTHLITVDGSTSPATVTIN